MIIMILYLVKAGINQYNNSKIKSVKVEMSDTWKLIFSLILLLQMVQIILFGTVIFIYDYIVRNDLFNVFINAYEKLDSGDMLDKSIRVLNYFDAAMPLMINCSGGDLIGRID